MNAVTMMSLPNQQISRLIWNQQISRLIWNQQSQKPSKTNVNGFVLESSQETLAKRIFKTYPETAVNVQSQDPELRTYYMNVLFNVIGTLCGRKSRDVSDADLSKASKGLSDLTQAGFKVEWLRPKLETAYLERKKRNACEARIVELKQEVKKLEGTMSGLKDELKNEKAKLEKRSSFRLLLGRLFCLKT